jgi:periplasmic protein CpxP/Spy
MSPYRPDPVAIELKRFHQELQLSEDQKEHLWTYLNEKYARLLELKRQNPNISRNEIARKIASIRASLREQAVRFLTPRQLERWDAEVAKAKDFLGHDVHTSA